MPKQAPERSTLLTSVAELGELAAGDLDPGQLGAARQADADLLADRGVGGRHGDVVEHRQRLGADADHVVDVHRHAVDADRVAAPELLGDQQLGADPVGGEGDPGPLVEPDHARVVAGQRNLARGAAELDRAQRPDQPGDRRVRGPLVDPGLRVGVARSRSSQLRKNRGGEARPGRRRRARAPGRARPGRSGAGRRGSRRRRRPMPIAIERRSSGDGAAPAKPHPLEGGGADDDRQGDRAREQVRLVAREAAPARGREGDAVARDARAPAPRPGRSRAPARRPAPASPRPRRCGRVSATSIAAAPASRPAAVARGPPSRRSIGRSSA